MSAQRRAAQTAVRRTSLPALSGWSGRAGVIRGCILLALTSAVLLVVLRQIEVGAVVEVLRRISPWTWIYATAVSFLFPLIAATRWRLMLRALGVNIRWTRLLTIILGVHPISMISPSRSGDLVRIYCLRSEVRGISILGSLLVERSLDLLTLSLFAGLGGAYFARPEIGAVAGVVMTTVILLLVVSRFADRLPARGVVRDKLTELSRVMLLLFSQPAALAGAIALTFCHWFTTSLLVTLLFYGTGVPVQLGLVMTAMPIAIMVGLVPVTLAGMGTREVAMIWLFSEVDMAPEVLSVGLLYTFFVYWLPGLLGLSLTKQALRI